jgi:hypothetical protein
MPVVKMGVFVGIDREILAFQCNAKVVGRLFCGPASHHGRVINDNETVIGFLGN